jgi:hypothetical protein
VGEALEILQERIFYFKGFFYIETRITDLAEKRGERWPQLFGQHVPFLKWRLAVI